jgi:hypothetical protein
MGVLPQAQEIIFKVQKKMSHEKIAKKKMLSNSQSSFIFFLNPSDFQSF